MSDTGISELDREEALVPDKPRIKLQTPRSAVDEPPSITGDDDFNALKPGSKFKDPEGNVRTKPFIVKEDSDFANVPEGAQFLDPEGNTRTKEKFEDIDFTSQTLFNMAVNDKEREKALARSYPGKVKRDDTGGFYVEDGETKRKPRGFTQSPGAFLTGQAVPTVASIAGEIGGGLAGSAAGPAGTFGGAVAGGAAGGAAGQAFNDSILQLAGVYDRSGGEEAGELGLSAAFGGAGSAIGRGLAAIGPGIKGAIRNALPKAAASFLGADAEGLEQGIKLRDKGVMVPPSTWAKEAPHVQNVVEVFDPAFRTQKPLLQSATEHYENSAKEILDDFGVKVEGSVVKPAAEASTKETGEKLLLKAREESSAADAALQAQLAERKAALEAGLPERIETQHGLRQAEAQARQSAQKLVDAGFEDIESDVGRAMKVAEAGSNSGDLWWSVGEKLKAVRQGIVARAKKMYDEADQLAGGHLPNIEGLPETAKAFLAELPEDFASRYPSVVKKLRDLAGIVDKESGEIVKETTDPTFGELHNIRSLLRDGADWHTLASDVKNGSYKFFANKVDQILHDIDAVPELKAAAKALDSADDFYRENMRVFQARNIKTVMDGLRAGEPADPQNLFNAIVKEGHSDLTKKVMGMIGPNLASGVRAADVQSMLDASKSYVPGQIDGMAFARQVLDRYRSGLLHAVQGEAQGDKLLKQAQMIAALQGKLDMPVRPGDTAMDIIMRARTAAEATKAAAKADPLSMLNKEMQKVVNDSKKEAASLRRERESEPLGFLYKPTMGASEAVDRILGNEDLILAAGAKFGEKSPEFNMLRQIWAQRTLQGTMEPGKALAKMSPEIQNIMFPGVSLEAMQTLAKEMDFLLSGKAGKDTAKSMAAVSKVEHPWGSIPLGKTAGKLIPGFDAAGRSMLGSYYKMITSMSNSPTFMRWVQKGLKGDPKAREMVRAEMQRHMQAGGAMGAGAGEATLQTPQQPEEQ